MTLTSKDVRMEAKKFVDIVKILSPVNKSTVRQVMGVARGLSAKYVSQHCCVLPLLTRV